MLCISGTLKFYRGMEAPNLYHVTKAEWVTGYLAGREDPGLSQGAMKHDLDAVTKVVQFWMQQPGARACNAPALRAWSGLVKLLPIYASQHPETSLHSLCLPGTQ